MEELDSRAGIAVSPTLRGRLVVTLFLFAGFLGIFGILARIDTREDFRDSLLIDCVVGLAVFALFALRVAPTLDLRKRRLRYAVSSAIGVVVSSLLVSFHIWQVTAREGTRQYYDETIEAGER